MRLRRTLLNAFTGLFSQIITIGLAFFIPRLIMVGYGSETNGLVNSISQIIGYLALLEAGVGAASLQALYKPVAEGDRGRINSILAATSAYYKKTGVYYFFAVILLAIVYPLIVESGYSMLTVFAIVLFTGLGGAVNYYFQGKFKVLLLAEGKSYIESSVVTVGNIVNNLVRIALLLQGVNIVTVQLAYFVIVLLQILAYQIYIRRHYHWLELTVKPDYPAISQKNSVMIHELSYLIFRNTDVLVLTLFTNLKVVSVYVLYNMIFNVVDSFVQTFGGSIKFALGQSFFEQRQKFDRLYNAYETYFIGLVFAVVTLAYLLVLPFMRLYTAGITDANYIDIWLPLLFAVSKLLMNARAPADNVIDIAGHFRGTQGRSIAESAINLVFSFGLVHWLGLYGVLLGTIVALLYRSVDMIFYANVRLLQRNPWLTLRKWLLCALLFVLAVLLDQRMELPIHSYAGFFLWAAILGLIVLPAYMAVLSIFERESFRYVFSFVKRIGGRSGKNPAAR
ncbi:MULTISPECIES: lipopolysaccharide biosynthesis protein [Saccharibacillus]|uniref:lipopolysaccharide biosynthesis protein n=1 Tax=Saccharibacillus TaxID=456492 RepID=UPI00123C2886|nr:sugar isomerase [Saccharibacillus sp. WB 17]MWJ32074.1 sugar isomerase [Saccharibacillus sp. WB 17]